MHRQILYSVPAFYVDEQLSIASISNHCNVYFNEVLNELQTGECHEYLQGQFEPTLSSLTVNLSQQHPYFAFAHLVCVGGGPEMKMIRI